MTSRWRQHWRHDDVTMTAITYQFAISLWSKYDFGISRSHKHLKSGIICFSMIIISDFRNFVSKFDVKLQNVVTMTSITCQDAIFEWSKYDFWISRHKKTLKSCIDCFPVVIIKDFRNFVSKFDVKWQKWRHDDVNNTSRCHNWIK